MLTFQSSSRVSWGLEVLSLLAIPAFAWAVHAGLAYGAEERLYRVGYPTAATTREAVWACLACGAAQLPVLLDDEERLGWIRKGMLALSWLIALPSLLVMLWLAVLWPATLLMGLAALSDPSMLLGLLCYLALAPAAVVALLRTLLDR